MKFKNKDSSEAYPENQKIAMRVSSISIIVNTALSLFKLLAGMIGHSGAMISDAVHSASDVISTVIVIIGIRMSNKQSDHDHQYGHERLECVSSIILSGLLIITGIGIGIGGLKNILAGTAGEHLVIPGMLALTAALFSLVIKEGMFWYTRAVAQKINSGALMADAWHHRSDALSSIGAFIGILGARFGYPILDPIVSVVICLFILKAAIDIFMDAIDKMVDHSCDDETVEQMNNVITNIPGVDRIDLIQTRLFGSKIYVDIEIAVDGALPLNKAHAIAETVHLSIENSFPNVKHCMVHVNPFCEVNAFINEQG